MPPGDRDGFGLIQRLITNLLANAIDASPSASEIEVRLIHLVRSSADRAWYRLQIIDHGEGISRENLKRVLIPYFTTKDRAANSAALDSGWLFAAKSFIQRWQSDD